MIESMTKKKLINEVVDQYKASRKVVEPLIDRRKQHLELYTGNFSSSSGSRVENADNISSHVPYVKTLLDNTHPLLTAKLPESKVSPRNTTKYYTNAKLMNALVDYTFDANNFQLKFLSNQKESMLNGDHFTKVVWSPDTAKNHPLLTSIDANNISVHVNKLDLEDEWPMFCRREMSKKQMKEETGWDKEMISSLARSKLGTKSYRRTQMIKLGLASAEDYKSGDEPEDDLYEVVERWGMMDFKGGDSKMGCVVVANEEQILNPDPYYKDQEPYESPFANNVMPFAQLSYDPLPYSFYSMSFIDPIADLQIELNDLENMKKSNYYRRNNPPIIVDKNADVDITSLRFLSGLPWIVSGGEKSVAPYILPDLSVSIDATQMMIRRTMQNVTGSQDILMTAPEAQPQGANRVNSAAHAQLLSQQIKTRFMPQAVLIDKYIERIGKLLINLWQDEKYWVGMKGNEVAIAIADDEGNNSQTKIKMQDIQGELDFIVTSATSIAMPDQALVTQAVNLRQLYAQDPTKNMEELDRVIFDKSGFDYNKIQKPKASYLPQLQQKLEQLITIAKQPDFKKMPPVEQQKIMQGIQQIQQQIQELSKGQAGGEPTQPEQTAQGQQLQPQGA